MSLGQLAPTIIRSSKRSTRCKTHLDALAAALAAHAERAETLQALVRRARELQGARRLDTPPTSTERAVVEDELREGSREGRSERDGALDRSVLAHGAVARDAAVDRADLREAARGRAARVDLHVGDAGGARRLHALRRADGPERRAGAMTWPSPFDYPTQGLAVRAARPAAAERRRSYTDAVFEAALPAIEARGGRAFVLCTTLRAVDARVERLRDAIRAARLRLSAAGAGRSASRTELLDRFRASGNAVLVGSQSFWEGVDVRGDALSLVVIDKLPFAPPDDPVLAARLEALHEEGRNAFVDHQLPQAVITLKQGAGRLIRDGDGSRRADDLRSAPRRQAVWPAHLAKPAAVQAHARDRRGARVLRGPGRRGRSDRG